MSRSPELSVVPKESSEVKILASARYLNYKQEGGAIDADLLSKVHPTEGIILRLTAGSLPEEGFELPFDLFNKALAKVRDEGKQVEFPNFSFAVPAVLIIGRSAESDKEEKRPLIEVAIRLLDPAKKFFGISISDHLMTYNIDVLQKGLHAGESLTSS